MEGEPQQMRVRLSRPHTGVSWGFRLQGGRDFTTALSVQLVQPGSVADQCGLKAGDGVLSINNVNADLLEHEQAKMEIIRSGNEVEFLIQRGAVTIWKPKVTAMTDLRPEELQTHALPGEAPPIQRTSLAHNQSAGPSGIGVAHNRTAQPFGAPAVQHAQFNTPISMYSAGNLADTFVQQTDALQHQIAQLGVNDGQQFPPPPPPEHLTDHSSLTRLDSGPLPPPPPLINGMQSTTGSNQGGHSNTNGNHTNGGQSLSPPITNNNNQKISPTMLLVQEELMAQKNNENGENIFKGTTENKQSRSFKLLKQDLDSGGTGEALQNRHAGIRSVRAPQTRAPGSGTQAASQNTCAACGALVTGVFVKVRGRPLHADCFRCVACRKSLKNQGYFWIEEKMYCEQHAREMTQPDDPDLVPVPVYH